MSRRSVYLILGGVGLAAAIVLAFLNVPQTMLDTTPSVAPRESVYGVEAGAQDKVTAPPAGGYSEGIKIHGDWSIEVREANGSLVGHYEFKNRLDGSGRQILAQTLARERTIGLWSIILEAGYPRTDDPCLDAGSSPARCTVTESSSSSTQPNVFKTLTVSRPAPNRDSLELSGTFVAQRDGAVERVATTVLLCSASVAPSTNCESSSVWVLTSTSLSSPVSVSADQQVLVTVAISFS